MPDSARPAIAKPGRGAQSSTKEAKINRKDVRTKKEGTVELQKIQHLPGNEYTRIELLTSAPASFEERAVRADEKHSQPAQVYVDIKDCSINAKIRSKISLNDACLSHIRTGRLDSGQVRVTLEAKSIEAYRVFSLPDPFRIIIDVRGKAPAPVLEKKPERTEVKDAPRVDAKEDARLPSLARQLSLDVKRIVLDPGHGGKDKGAISPNNTYEKNITLAIALELKKILISRLGCEVILTRSTDRYISLEERTAIANSRNADLFISIHTNAHADQSLCGTETYYLNFSKDSESARVAAVENAGSSKKISDLEAILHDLMLNTKLKESAQLAGSVQSNILSRLRAKQYDGLRDKGIKQAPFCVLIGAQMPSILIETAFITNQVEERRLKDRKFRRELAEGIAKGVESYIQEIKGKALAKAGDGS